MRAVSIVFLLAALVLVSPAQRSAQSKKKREFNAPKVGVVDFEAHRDGRFLSFEGHVKNLSDKPLIGIVLYFEFFEVDDKMISKKNIVLTEAEVDPGEECDILAQTPSVARVITVRLDAYDTEGRPLGVDKPGPYYIE